LTSLWREVSNPVSDVGGRGVSASILASLSAESSYGQVTVEVLVPHPGLPLGAEGPEPLRPRPFRT